MTITRRTLTIGLLATAAAALTRRPAATEPTIEAIAIAEIGPNGQLITPLTDLGAGPWPEPDAQP